jgi:hypothetical protein
MYTFEKETGSKKDRCRYLLESGERFVWRLENVEAKILPVARECILHVPDVHQSCFKGIEKAFASELNGEVDFGNIVKAKILGKTILYDQDADILRIQHMDPYDGTISITLNIACCVVAGRTTPTFQAKAIWLRKIVPDEEAITVEDVHIYAFSRMTIDDQRRYYPNGKVCHERENSIVMYGLSPLFAGDDCEGVISSIEEYASGKKLSLFLCDESGSLDCKAVDGMDSYGCRHYKVSMTDPKNKQGAQTFMNYAKRYLEIRGLDVRGLWYDVEPHESESHIARIHLVSPLDIEKIRTLFWSWQKMGKKCTVSYLMEPTGWRVFASKNHGILTGQKTSMTHPKVRHAEFVKHIKKICGDRKFSRSSDLSESVLKFKLY